MIRECRPLPHQLQLLHLLMAQTHHLIANGQTMSEVYVDLRFDLKHNLIAGRCVLEGEGWDDHDQRGSGVGGEGALHCIACQNWVRRK